VCGCGCGCVWCGYVDVGVCVGGVCDYVCADIYVCLYVYVYVCCGCLFYFLFCFEVLSFLNYVGE
jgi:hypothetical protein